MIEDSLIRQNTVTESDGGGIYIYYADVSIRRSEITDNKALSGTAGGVYQEDSTTNLTDTDVTHNSSLNDPGGYYNGGTVNVYGDVNITDNDPSNCGGNDIEGCFG